MNIQIIRTSFALSAACILLCGCGSKETSSFDKLMSGMNSPPRRGLWQKDGATVNLKKVREIKLEAKGDNPEEEYFQAIFRKNHFYLIDSSSPSIFVYDSSGAYLRAVAVNPAPGDYWAYFDIGLTTQGNFLLKDAQTAEIQEIDSTGVVVSKWSARRLGGAAAENAASGEDNICPFGLCVVEESGKRFLFSSIFPFFDYSNPLTNTYLVGRFDENGRLTNKFAERSPVHARYTFDAFPFTTIFVAGDELFLLEFPVPTIRVFSFAGESKREFGVWGAHQRPLAPMPARISGNEQRHRTFNYSQYHRLKTLDFPGVSEKRLIVVSYMNPLPFDAEKSKQDGWTESDYHTYGEHYLMLYTTSGELLVNDVPLPGMLIDLDDQGRLVLLLRDDPDDRRIGFYRLEAGSRKLALLDQ
jgi:hypothetical protein